MSKIVRERKFGITCEYSDVSDECDKNCKVTV